MEASATTTPNQSSSGLPSMLEDRHNNNTRLNPSPPDNLKTANAANMSDIEQFQGKIVYNPDGSAYIIEDGDYSDEEELPVPMQEGSIIEKPGHQSNVDQFPTIENAIYVARTKSLNNYPAYVRAQTTIGERPTVHSYRVYNYRHKTSDSNSGPIPVETTPENIPVKPILMCFICKLSFGNIKSFMTHCKEEHNLDFNEDEREMLRTENISALIQQVGKDKAPLISFLEPVVKGHQSPGPEAGHEMRSPSKSPHEGNGQIRVRNDLAASAASQISPVSNGRSSTSPGVTSLSPSPSSFNPQSSTGSYPSKGTTIGACPDHINGRPTSLDCAKCDLIINTNRLGSLGWNASNNACKTLKCPKCNWHYKYQETLEIHMKEKHPDSDSNCIYCITGQQHPRLARGETYTCGYKPYRCEVCNYSTTTKGNLSIHMQSDKHINNMQELQNNGGQAPASPAPSIVTPSGTPKPQEIVEKDKPCWRCDICNYETNIARNLRIHMTSEKHMNNIVNLQQMNLGNGDGPALPPNLPSLPNMPAPGSNPGQPNLQQLLSMSPMGRLPGLPDSPMKEAAMADMAFNQAILMQMMGGGGPPPGFPGMPPMPGLPFLPTENQGDPMESEQPDPNPQFLYSCAVCRVFSTDSLQALSDHLSIDRTKLRENEVSIQIGGTFICKLCSYKTNLKANFQLHCKTDKHLQKLQLVNHIMEGGPANEWKLNFMNVSNSVQLRCNACDFYTDSIHKLQIHTANQGHEVSAAIFNHLRKAESELLQSGLKPENLSYNCVLCKESFPGKGLLLQHCRSVKHLQMEQLHILQLRAEGGANTPEIGEIFTVTADKSENNETGDSNKDSKKEDKKEDSRKEESDRGDMICPLCQEGFKDKDTLEQHAMQLHSINAEGLQRLMMLMQGSHWLNSIKNANKEDEERDSDKVRDDSLKRDELERSPGSAQVDKYSDPSRPYKCEVCRESFTQKSILLVHYNSVGHLRNLKKKMQEQQNEGGENANSGESDLDKSGCSEPEVQQSPKKEDPENNVGDNPLQSALQQAMIARLQLLNPMLRAPGMPPLNPAMAMMGAGLPPFGPGMPQLQQLQQLAMAQQMSGAGGPGANPRLPDPSLILQQLSQLQGNMPEMPKMDSKPPGMPPLPFPPVSPGPGAGHQPPPPMAVSQAPTGGSPQFSQDLFGEQKRARTKITEDQLKVLRANFDISNSPSDDQINMMAQQTGLPPKVIKHWFRNTLFKERQKNKDSPYNFNNPPSTMINLEEYEKTGEAKVNPIEKDAENAPNDDEVENNKRVEKAESPEIMETEPVDAKRDSEKKSDIEQSVPSLSSSPNVTSHNNSSINFNSTNPVPNVTQSSLQTSLTLSSILSSQTMADSLSHLPNYPAPLPSPFGQSSETNSFSKMLHNLAVNSNMSELSEPSSPQGGHHRLSPGQQDMSIHGKRANRTRFSDYQVKVLQEFFEKNAYPKDDDLEYLSKLLGLTPRVIVVWFQNARQKARKAYENQPSTENIMNDDVEGRFTRTPSLSYQCKKCNLEFQRYYELIRHQKQHCYKEEDAKRSALAQKAAAQAAASLGQQGGMNMTAISNYSEDSNSSISYSERNITSPVFNQNTLSWKRKLSTDDSRDVIEETRNKLPKTTNLFPPMIPPTPTTSSNDLEASMRKFYEDTMKRYMDELQGRPASESGQALDLRSSSADLDQGSHRSENDNDSDSWEKNLSGGEDSSSEQMRGLSSDFDGDGDHNMSGGFGDQNGQRDSAGNKRFRTHMSNVQIKMMKSIFENYKTPTMPECQSLGNDIGLAKRVVQVWFQNARAKEKKARLYLQQVTGVEPDLPPTPTGCRWCNIKYPENFAIQEHIFQKSHLDKVKAAIEQGLYDPESPGVSLTQQAEALQNGGMMQSGHLTPPRHGQDSNTDSSPSPSKPSLGPGLSMMAQMAAGGIRSPGGPDGPHMPDSRSMLMPQFYGMNSYPIGVTNTVHNV